MDDLTNIDLYELLQIETNATEKEIKTAYRKKALTCHPDKNPDDPKAAENFQRLSKALEILTDGAAKAAYDRVLKSRKDRVIRHRQLDAKRKKLKDDLDERERNAKEEVISEADAAKKLQEHIERLRKEGSKHLEEERLLLKKQIEEEAQLAKMKLLEEANKPKLKFMWKSSKKDPENGGYNNSNLMDIFQKYGEVTCLVLGKKGGSCLVEYQSVDSAVLAHETEKGLTENPLTSTWLQGQPVPKTEDHHEKPNRPSFPQINIENQRAFSFRDGDSGTITERDYESVVLTKMRQAQERKRLIEEMEKDDGH